MTTRETPTIRHAARVVLVDENGRVLLARFEYKGNLGGPHREEG